MARARIGKRQPVAPADRAAGAAPARKCGRSTRRCLTCTHHRRAHTNGADRCVEPKCKCVRFVAKPCAQPALENGACRLHGGLSLAGAAHPNFRHGGRSKYLQYMHGKLAEKYQAATTDPDLISLSAELALTEARIADVLEQMDFTASRARWSAAAQALEQLQAAAKAGRAVDVAAASDRLQQVLRAGAADSDAGAQLSDLTDLKRRLAEGQARIVRDTHQMLSMNQLLTIISQVVDVVSRNVKDPREVSAVVTDLKGLVGEGIGPQIGAVHSGGGGSGGG